MQSSFSQSLTDLSWRIPLKCNGGTCIQVAATGDKIVIGSPEGPILAYSHSEWITFVEGVRQGDFDDLIPSGA